MPTVHTIRKVTCPQHPPTILHREPLVAALTGALAGASLTTTEPSHYYKLVLLCAPAGYGKTTLLVDCATHSTLPWCWYVLDSADTDKLFFLQGLIASMRHRFPQFGRALDSFFTAEMVTGLPAPTIMRHCEHMINALASTIEGEIAERFALVLCNYHEVNGHQDINTLMNRLLRQLPTHCVVVIESRATPSLDLASLLARRQVFGLGSNDLRFSVRDIGRLAQLLGATPLSDGEAEQLAASFEGWIAGIFLGTRLGDIQLFSPSAVASWGAPAVRMERQQLFAYLVQEVFTREPEVYAFLKEAVVLQQMTPQLCNALLGRADAEERLATAEQHGLFATRSGTGSQLSYSCHPVLREVLAEELRRQHPEHLSALHLRAAQLLHEVGDDHQAILHALQAGADDLAAHLIMEASKFMLVQGYSETMAGWIDALPVRTLERYPQLLFARANIYLTHYETARTFPLLDKAREGISCSPSPSESDITPTLVAEILIARSIAFCDTGDYLQAQTLCEQALAVLPADERVLRALAYQRFGICTSLLGDCTTGIAHLQHALQLWGQQTENHQRALLHGQLAKAYNMLGNYALAEHHRAYAIRSCEHLGDVWGKINSVIGMGVIHLHQGAFVEAESVLTQTLAIAREHCFQSGEAYSLVNLGELYQEQDRYQQALTVTEEGLALARHQEDSYLINFALCTLAMIYLSLEDPQTALVLLAQVELKTSSNTSYEGNLCELILGAVYLYQQRYEEACACLSSAETIATRAGWKRRQVQAIIRLAACQFAQVQQAAAILTIEHAVALAQQGGYEHLLQIEVRRQPALQDLLHTLPEAASMQRALSQETEASTIAEALPGAQGRSVPVTTPSRIQVFAFGEPAVLLDGVPITRWRLTRSLELLFFLLSSNRPVHKDQILAALWPNGDEQSKQLLRSTLHYLRKAIGEACVISHAGTYALNLAARYRETCYDVVLFRACHARAKKAAAVQDEQAAISAYEEMVHLYRGDYVQSFYGDWCLSQRDELRRSYLDARDHLARSAWRRGQFEESLLHWQHVLAVDNTCEAAHYGVMCCYLRQGKRGLALRQYQRCVEILREELDVSPGPTIQKLYQRLTGATADLAPGSKDVLKQE